MSTQAITLGQKIALASDVDSAVRNGTAAVGALASKAAKVATVASGVLGVVAVPMMGVTAFRMVKGGGSEALEGIQKKDGEGVASGVSMATMGLLFGTLAATMAPIWLSAVKVHVAAKVVFAVSHIVPIVALALYGILALYALYHLIRCVSFRMELKEQKGDIRKVEFLQNCLLSNTERVGVTDLEELKTKSGKRFDQLVRRIGLEGANEVLKSLQEEELDAIVSERIMKKVDRSSRIAIGKQIIYLLISAIGLPAAAVGLGPVAAAKAAKASDFLSTIAAGFWFTVDGSQIADRLIDRISSPKEEPLLLAEEN